MEEPVSLNTLTVDDFEKHVNTLFTFDDGSQGWPLTLTSVSTIPGRRHGDRQPFSLIFTGPPDVVLQQRTYPFDHPSLGRLEMFIVPVERDAEGTRYEAIFS